MASAGRIRDFLHSDMFRYFVASMAALAVDLATLSASLRVFGFSLAWAATIGFLAGAVTIYLLSIGWVFRNRMFGTMPAMEFLLFLAIGIAGLGVTQLLLWLGSTLIGFTPELVKLAAAGATFMFNFAVRKMVLFAAGGRFRVAQEKPA